MTAATMPVVVVTHAGPSDRMRRCLESIAAAGGAGPVVVVDNSGAARHVAEFGGLADEVLSVTNDGYGAAANVGFTAAWKLAPDAGSVALLNDDIEVELGWLPPLIGALAAGAAVAQPKLLRAPKTDLPLVNSVGVQIDRFGAGTDIGDGEPDGVAYEAGRDIEMFIGGAVVFDRGFIDATGGFDERYFLYYEDVDLALRGAELGYRYRCEPASVVWHEGGASTSARRDETRRLQERNRLWCAFRFAEPSVVRRAIWLSIRRLRHVPRTTHARALLGGVAGLPTRSLERRRAHRAESVAS